MQYDIVCIQESWLDDQTDDEELSANYTVLRKDRSNFRNSHLRGGGIITLVHNEITCRVLEGFPDTIIEFIVTLLNIDTYQIILVNIYLPPYKNRIKLIQELDFVLQTLRNNFPNIPIVICGDLNASRIN